MSPDYVEVRIQNVESAQVKNMKLKIVKLHQPPTNVATVMEIT